MEMGIKVEWESSDTVQVAQLRGRLDVNSAPIFEKKIQEKLRDKVAIVLNFREVTYLSSAGLRVLLSLAKKIRALGGRMTLCYLAPDVLEVIRIAGFEQVLTISSDMESAKEWVKS